MDFVVVTSLGIEQLQTVPGGRSLSLKLVSEAKKSSAPISWCIYTHETRWGQVKRILYSPLYPSRVEPSCTFW